MVNRSIKLKDLEELAKEHDKVKEKWRTEWIDGNNTDGRHEFFVYYCWMESKIYEKSEQKLTRRDWELIHFNDEIRRYKELINAIEKKESNPDSLYKIYEEYDKIVKILFTPNNPNEH